MVTWLSWPRCAIQRVQSDHARTARAKLRVTEGVPYRAGETGEGHPCLAEGRMAAAHAAQVGQGKAEEGRADQPWHVELRLLDRSAEK